jgi:membrane-associated protease RseP (regulator of RpoE activity)
MLLQASTPVESRCPHRWSVWTAARLLTLVVFLLSVGFVAPVSGAKDETKKDQAKKEESAKDSSKKDATKPEPGRNQGGRPGVPTANSAPLPPGAAFLRGAMRLGAQIDPVSAEVADQLDLPKGQGMIVRNVVPDSPAAKAGLKAHDVILEIDGKKVPNNFAEAARLIADIKKDATVDVVVLRKGKKETIKEVKLPEAKGIPSGGFPGGRPPAFGQPQVAFNPGIGGFGAVATTTIIQMKDRFTLRHQEGPSMITLTGTVSDGTGKVTEIVVQDGGRVEKYESVDKVPEKHQDKVKKLIEISEKSTVKSDSKSKEK